MYDCACGIDPPLPDAVSPRSSRRGAFLTFLLLDCAVIAGHVAGKFAPLWIREVFRPLRLDLLNGIATCFVAFVASVAIHEFGHYVAARLVGFEVTGFSLGPLRLTRAQGQWSAHLLWRRFFQGAVMAVPKSQAKWRSKMFVVVAAGPLATALLALSAFSLIRSGDPAFVGGFWQAVLQINTVLSLLALIPGSPNAEQVSDTRLLLMIIRFNAQARSVLLYQVLTHVRLEGARPRDYPEWIIRRAAVAEGRLALQAAFAQSVADWALDRGDWPTAEAWSKRLSAVVDECKPRLCYTALAHGACLDLVLRNDMAAAQRKIERTPVGLLAPRSFRFRSQAILAFVRGEREEGMALLDRAELSLSGRKLPCSQYELLMIGVLRSLMRSANPRSWDTGKSSQEVAPGWRNRQTQRT